MTYPLWWNSSDRGLSAGKKHGNHSKKANYDIPALDQRFFQMEQKHCRIDLLELMFSWRVENVFVTCMIDATAWPVDRIFAFDGRVSNMFYFYRNSMVQGRFYLMGRTKPQNFGDHIENGSFHFAFYHAIS